MEEQGQAKPRVRWWVWGVVAAVVLVAGGAIALCVYDARPGNYRLIRHCALRYGSKSNWDYDNGLLLQESHRLLVFRDIDGREQWHITMPAPDVRGLSSSAAAKLNEYNPWRGDIAVSPNGYFCAVAVAGQVDRTVYTWQAGKLVGTVRVSVPLPQELIDDELLHCANDGSVFLSVDEYGDGPITTYLIEGNRFMAKGVTGFLCGSAVDKRNVYVIDPYSHSETGYANVTVKGKELSISAVTKPAPYRHHGTVDSLHYNIFMDQQLINKKPAPVTWQYYPDSGTGVTLHLAFIRMRGSRLHLDFADGATIASTAASRWFVALPHDTTAVIATSDDQHVLVGHGYCLENEDTFWWSRSWPVVGGVLPEVRPKREDVKLSLYNRSGRCETILPFEDIKRMQAQVSPVAARNTDDRILPIASSRDGSRLILLIGNDVFFLRAEPHLTVWETVTGWMRGKG
jgi:hypothetical protein